MCGEDTTWQQHLPEQLLHKSLQIHSRQPITVCQQYVNCPALFEGCKLRYNDSSTQISGMCPAQLPGIAWVEGGEGSFYESLHHCFMTSAWEDKKPPESERQTLKLTQDNLFSSRFAPAFRFRKCDCKAWTYILFLLLLIL